MNERMREPFHTLMWKASIGYNDSWSKIDPEVLEKFAELIIKECYTIIKESCVEVKSDEVRQATGLNTIVNLTQVTCKNKLCEHFGVDL